MPLDLGFLVSTDTKLFNLKVHVEGCSCPGRVDKSRRTRPELTPFERGRSSTLFTHRSGAQEARLSRTMGAEVGELPTHEFATQRAAQELALGPPEQSRAPCTTQTRRADSYWNLPASLYSGYRGA